jgi:hypothetical protein
MLCTKNRRVPRQQPRTAAKWEELLVVGWFLYGNHGAARHPFWGDVSYTSRRVSIVFAHPTGDSLICGAP